MGLAQAQPEGSGIRVEETPLLALMMLSRSATQLALKVVLDEEIMKHMENSLPEVTKSMSEAVLEEGGMDCLEKTMVKSQKMVEDFSLAEMMNAVN